MQPEAATLGATDPGAAGSSATETGATETGAAGATITASGGSIAAGTIMGDAILGPVVQVGGGALPSPASVPAPPGLHNLPRPPAGVFAGRDALLDRLADLAAGVGHVLHGLGGAGKSELALHVAHSARDAGTVVWWVSAETAETITLGLAELTRRLHPAPTLADAREWAIGWLQAHPGWLLVLDNVADPGHVTDLLGRVDGLGRILVTTRRDLGDAVWSRLGLATVPVGPLGRVASVDVLVRLSGRGAGDAGEVVEAARLAADLGDLPLALTQAAAFVTQRDMPFGVYRQRLAARPARMHAATAEGTDAERAVDRVWSLTMESIAERSEHAGPLLTVMSALAAEPVPEEILIAAEFRRDGEEFDIEDAIALLASYSMVARGDGRVWVHRLVQAVTRARADADALAEAVEEAVTMLRIDLRTRSVEDPANWPHWNELLPHIEALDTHRAEMTDSTLSSFGILRVGSGEYLELQGQSARAIEIYEGMRPDWIRLFGEEDRSVVQLVNKLAIAYKSVGRYDDAIEQLQWAADHLEMDELGLTVGSNLAAAYSAVGDWINAARILEAVATMFERLCGADDPRTLTVKNNLAVALLDALEHALETFERHRAIILKQRKLP